MPKTRCSIGDDGGDADNDKDAESSLGPAHAFVLVSKMVVSKCLPQLWLVGEREGIGERQSGRGACAERSAAAVSSSAVGASH